MDDSYTKYMINANDFSLYAKIDSTKLTWYNHNFNDMDNGQSRGSEIKQYIKDLIQLDGIQVIRIDLVFDNRDMIHYLELRGEAIKN